MVETDHDGRFEIEFGLGDVISDVEFGQLQPGIDYHAELMVSRRQQDVMLYSGPFSSDAEGYFRAEAETTHQEMFSGTLRGTLSLFDNDSGNMVWQERARFYVEDDGSFEILMGYGRLVYANRTYFGLDRGSREAEVIKPLDYTNAMLVFSLLGFVGLIFAFLLKREDKTSGYGLELPNKDID